MKSTKKSLLASGLSLLVCAALLVGTTFAWFTDSVTNKGNSIQAGSLLINAYAYKLGTGGQTCTIPGVNGDQAFTFTATPQDLKTDSTPIISEPMWEPGASSAKLLQVTNGGTLAAKLKLDFTTSGDLTNALWFDFIQIGEDGNTIGQFTQRPMNTLATFAEKLELPLDSGATVRFILVYGMYETAGSEYMGDSFTADVSIVATQQTKEADGFGNINYDKNADYPVTSAADLNTALKESGTVVLGSDIQGVFTLSKADVETTVDLNNKQIGDLTDTGGYGIFNVRAGTLTISGEGTVNGLGDNDWSMAIWADGNGTVNIENGHYTNVGAGDDTHYDLIYASGNAKIYISGGTFQCQTPAWTLNVRDADYRAGTADIIVTGGSFYQFDPSDCNSEGAHTNFVAEGYKVVHDGDWYNVVPE